MLLTILTAIVVLWVTYSDAVPTLLYQLGRQRQLYFSPEIRLLKFERTSLVLLLLVYKFVWALSRSFRNTPMQITALITTATLMASFPLLMYFLVRWFTPTWVRQFEADYPDFELAQKQAQVQMMMYPTTFPKVIRHAAGWDVWLLTISRDAILSKNFVRYNTYNGKYLWREAWGSWFFAGITAIMLIWDSGKLLEEFSPSTFVLASGVPIIFNLVFVAFVNRSKNSDTVSLATTWGLHSILSGLAVFFGSLGIDCVSGLTLGIVDIF